MLVKTGTKQEPLSSIPISSVRFDNVNIPLILTLTPDTTLKANVSEKPWIVFDDNLITY